MNDIFWPARLGRSFTTTKIKKRVRTKKFTIHRKTWLFKIFLQQGRTSATGSDQFSRTSSLLPFWPYTLKLSPFFFFNFFFIIGLHERSRTGHMIIVYWFSCLLSEPTHSSTGISDNCYRRPLSFGSLKNTSKSFIFVNRIYIYIYIYIYMCVCVCVCVLLLLDCFFYLIKYGLEQFFW